MSADSKDATDPDTKLGLSNPNSSSNSSSSLVAPSATHMNNIIKSNRLKGMKIRDEFICPITYELMREPVVASDGHTYERNAIEKWLKSNSLSPRTGDTIVNTVIPNINLRKLIQDIINEGGASFYIPDDHNSDRLFDVRPEKVLILECLGPPESDWNAQSFQVNHLGVIGGRKLYNSSNDSKSGINDRLMRESILFRDITVSRRHFEIFKVDYNNPNNPTPYSDGVALGLGVDVEPEDGSYCIRDLGSAGGTFMRIPFGTRKQLLPGMIVLLGKHQFTVSSIDDKLFVEDDDNENGHEHINDDVEFDSASSKYSSNYNSNSDLNVMSEKLHNLSLDLSNVSNLGEVLGKGLRSDCAKESQFEEDPKEDPRQTNQDGNGSKYLGNGNGNDLQCKAINPVPFITATADTKDQYEMTPRDTHTVSTNYTSPLRPATSRRCVLTCCAPDGSPLQGKSFPIGVEGACLGRKASNTIALFVKATELSMNGDGKATEKVISVDTAISSEHATVKYDIYSDSFYIADGTASKPSTNGTWFRLSGPQQPSPPYLLSPGNEVLIGTVRFLARESITISEHGVVSATNTNTNTPIKILSKEEKKNSSPTQDEDAEGKQMDCKSPSP